MEQEITKKASTVGALNATESARQAAIKSMTENALKLQLSQANVRTQLEKKGIIFDKDGCTVQLAESLVNGEHLVLCMRCMKNDGNQLVYVLFEKLGSIEYGLERKEQYITDKHIKDMRSSIDDIINSFTGIYDNHVASIKIDIKKIHSNRLLKGIRYINTDKVPLGIVVERLKEWILENANDSRIGIMELKGIKRIVILCPKGYKKGVMVGGIFKQIFNEIAPENKYGAFKAELVRQELIICDKNSACLDIQKTISKAKCMELGTDHVKVICFNFAEEFVEQVSMLREDINDVLGISDEELERMFAEDDALAMEYMEEEEV